MLPAGASARGSAAKIVFRFLVVSLLVAAALIGVWSFIAPVYTKAVALPARVLLRWVESPNVSVLEVRDAELWVYRIVGPGKVAPFVWFDRYTFFILIPFLALLMATPGLGWARRVARLAIGVVALWCGHAVHLAVSLQLSYAATGLAVSGPFLGRALTLWQVGTRLLWEAAPIAIWIGLTRAPWRKALRTCREGARPCRVDSEPIPAGG